MFSDFPSLFFFLFDCNTHTAALSANANLVCFATSFFGSESKRLDSGGLLIRTLCQLLHVTISHHQMGSAFARSSLTFNVLHIHQLTCSPQRASSRSAPRKCHAKYSACTRLMTRFLNLGNTWSFWVPLKTWLMLELRPESERFTAH